MYKNSIKKIIDRRLEFNSEFARKNNKMWKEMGDANSMFENT